MTKKIFWSILLVAGIVLIASFVTIMDSLYRYFSSLAAGSDGVPAEFCRPRSGTFRDILS